MATIEQFRNHFANHNKKTLKQRLDGNDPVEMWMLDNINRAGIMYLGQRYHGWVFCGVTEDRVNKKDIKCKLPDGKWLYAQMKWRQPGAFGNDCLASVIQPWPGKKDAIEVIKTGTLEYKAKHFWARDYVFKGHLYLSLSQDWDRFRVLDYRKSIKPRIDKLLKEFLKSGDDLTDRNRTYCSSWNPKFQLKWVRDAGKGSYDSGLQKLVCYIPASEWEPGECTIIEMSDPSDEYIKMLGVKK